jgi:undecaprenyl-diphosphatase
MVGPRRAWPRAQRAVAPNRFVLTPRMIRAAAWAGAIALAVGTFLLVTHETVTERRGGAFDRAVLLWLAQRRTPHLTAIMIDLTALGSSTLVAVFTSVTFALLVAVRDWRGAALMAIASAGTSLWTSLTKNLIEKARPTVVEHLVAVTGFSYPSGHSLAAAALYLTIGLVAASHLKTTAPRVVVVAGVAVVIALGGLSRMYLGVHYPSDVLAGVSLGAAWALILAAALARRRPPGDERFAHR